MKFVDLAVRRYFFPAAQFAAYAIRRYVFDKTHNCRDGGFRVGKAVKIENLRLITNNIMAPQEPVGRSRVEPAKKDGIICILRQLIPQLT
jgi:hypothetical protein